MGIDLLLINSPTDDYGRVHRADYYTLPPLGLGSIATTCEQRGFKVAILDAERQGLSPEQIVSEVEKQGPAFVGLNPLPPNYKLVRQIAHRIWERTQARVIFGGPYCTIRTEQVLLDNTFAFAVIRGEGEMPVALLLEEHSRQDIPGVSFMERGNPVLGDTVYLVDNLDRLPHIDRKFFIDDPCCIGNHRESALVTSRGCPFSCIFCGASQVAGHRIRNRSVSDVVNEIQELADGWNVDSFYFIDDLFFLDPERITQFAKSILNRKLKIRWRGLARADVLAKRFDESIMKLTARSGCHQIAFGIESGTARVQNMIRKHLELEFVNKAISLCSRSGIQTKGYFMLGFPGETKAEMLETIKFASQCGLDTAFFFGVRAFPGTEMYESLLAEGKTPNELDEYIQLSDLITDPLTREGLRVAGVDPDSLVKYNVLHSSPIATVDNAQLIELLQIAYQRFYVRFSRGS